MLPGPCDGHTVQQFKEVKVEPGQQVLRCPFWLRQLAPCVIYLLRLTKNGIDIRLDIQLLIEVIRIALISQRKLIPQIVKAVIDRGGGEHQDFGLNTGFYDSVHQPHIAVFFFTATAVCAISVSEIMAFVDDNQIVIPPVDAVNW